MTPATTSRRTLIAGAAAATTLAATAAAAEPAAAAGRAPRPTIVLVHGAWADASGWSKVTHRLQCDGCTVLAAPNPLRGLSADSGYLAAFLRQHTAGPVVLVGHSYGGAVITNAAVGGADVRALVYVNAFVPDRGDSILSLLGDGVDPAALADFVQYPDAPAGDVDIYIKTALFRQVFAADLPAADAATLAAAQRPITFAALRQPSGEPAWKSLPTWYVRGTADVILPPATQLTMARRAGSRVIDVAASHLSMLSRPDVTVAAIRAAARSVR